VKESNKFHIYETEKKSLVKPVTQQNIKNRAVRFFHPRSSCTHARRI